MATILSIVSYPFLPARVGGQKGIALFNKYFSKYHRLICVTTKKNDPSAAEGYQVLNLLSNSRLRYLNVFYFFLFRRLIREKNASHVLLEHPYYGWLGFLLKRFCGVKIIVHSHNLEGLRWKTLGKWWWWFLWIYEKYTHRMADFNFFIHDESKQYAIDHFRLDPAKCLTMTYGIEWNKLPDKDEIRLDKGRLREQFHLGDKTAIFLFNGAFNYGPNRDALMKIIEIINPLLVKKADFDYRIIICGRDIPVSSNKKDHERIIIAGYVDDIGLFCMGSDVFLNPITEGGGIKTKLVEALAYNLNAVSTASGATGIPTEICNGKLLLCKKEEDWDEFVQLICEATKLKSDTPKAYFDHFYWGYSTQRAAEMIEK
jgi:glycosyltransferase involved in cell wall biosynthesis